MKSGAERLTLHFFVKENCQQKNARLAETLAQGLCALMKKILQKGRVWTFFHRQYLEEFDTYQKLNIVSLQRIEFFNES